MREKALYALVAIFFALLSACTQAPQSVTLRSLESSGRMSFLCLGRNYQPRSIDDCPDLNPVDDEQRYPYALVTQKTRGEVAMVNVTFGAGGVVDEEPDVPGFNFLPVGANPTAIVSTPGGVASFVGVAEVGKEGIFGLPTSCVAPRAGSQQVRDLTSWPACRLPSAPGEMALLLDAKRSVTCDGTVSPPPASTRCPADLSTELKAAGQRRKLAVALPDGAVRGGPGGIAIYDAQEILDTPPGSYEPCHMERWIPLSVKRQDPTTIAEVLPADLIGLPLPGPSHGPETPFSSRPAGFAQIDDPTTGEHRLFVADLDAPVIHDLDTTDPCNVHEDAPLEPWSYAIPSRDVTTTKVAASPLTTDGKRFLYAIDELQGGSVEIGGLGGGTVMIFDVSPGSTEKTPIVRPNSKRFPFEAPDRIAFAAPVEDVAFGLRDFPSQDPATGVGQIGTLCDPNPATPLTSVGATYRPAIDFSSGANAGNLRGIFGFLALSSGQVAVIDVEDFDAPCRRPIQTNPTPTEDFRGCSGDTIKIPLTTPPQKPCDPDPRQCEPLTVPSGSLQTVTNEVSCRAVEPHRARSGSLMLTSSDLGTRAPSLRALPKLVDLTGQALSVDATPDGRQHPRMLGVNFAAPGPSPASGQPPTNNARAQVYVGTTLFVTKSSDPKEQADSGSTLDIDPATATQNSLVLSMAEPRSYSPLENFSAKFEGSLFGERPAGRFDYRGGVATLTDAGLNLCDTGIEDEVAAGSRGSGLGVDPSKVPAFATAHADYVKITSDLLANTDAYWSADSVIAGCGGYDECQAAFGTRAEPSVYRELSIIRATPDTLTVGSRTALARTSGGTALNARVAQRLACCFPTAVSYEVRASNEWVVRGNSFHHNIHTITLNGENVCSRDLSPLKKLLTGRAIEVTCDPTSPDCFDANGKAKIGLANADPSRPSDVACVVQHPSTDAATIDVSPFSPCVYTGLAGSFTVYRGARVDPKSADPQKETQLAAQGYSARDMEFDWSVAGGFVPLSISLVSTDQNSTPESMVYVPGLNQLVVADGVSSGIVLVDLATLVPQQFY